MFSVEFQTGSHFTQFTRRYRCENSFHSIILPTVGQRKAYITMKQSHQEDKLETPRSPTTENVDDEQSLFSPYFYYHDFSKEPDADPSVPLTAPGRVPNFPAKMHAILSRDDLSDIVGWMPHGRAWKVFKQREFEVKILPIYFEHSKFSSFIRQANGWGFRRINSGCDRNCYYHPRFLKGLPHLCKGMKRPGVAQKLQSNPKHEPDLYKISELFPLPKGSNKESVILFSTLSGGAKTCLSIGSNQEIKKPGSAKLTPREFEALSAFYTSLNSVEGGQQQTIPENSMKMISNPSFFPKQFYSAPATTTSLFANYGQDVISPCVRPFQSYSDANDTALYNLFNV